MAQKLWVIMIFPFGKQAVGSFAKDDCVRSKEDHIKTYYYFPDLFRN